MTADFSTQQVEVYDDSGQLVWSSHPLPQWLLDLREAVNEIEYKDWDFIVRQTNGGTPYLQIVFNDPEDGSVQRCRMWLLYPTMNRSEVIRTALMAVLAAEEHEAREKFRFKGVRVFAPHIDVDELADFAKYKKNLAITEDPHG